MVWLPILSGDDEKTARRRSEEPSDPRLNRFWDAGCNVSRLFRPLLGLHGPAWDLYLLYRIGVRWSDDEPPAPDAWMHQLGDEGADPALCLDPVRLAEELQHLLSYQESR